MTTPLYELYIKYKETSLRDLESDEYMHLNGSSESIEGEQVRHYTEEEFESKLRANRKFALKWG